MKNAGFAERISRKLVQKGIVRQEDADLYRYGIESGVTVAGNLLASVILGIVTGRLGVILVFLLFYSSLRSFAGGMHCKSRTGCFFFSLAILLVPACTRAWVMEAVPCPVLIGAGAAAVAAVMLLSPVESANKPLDQEEKLYYRKISRCITVFQVCVLAFLLGMGWLDYFYAGYSSLVLVAVFLAAGKILAKCYR